MLWAILADDKPMIFFLFITKTRLFKYFENSPPKTESFPIKILIFFHITAQNIERGYSLEPHHRGGSNEYTQSIFEQK